MSKITVNNVSNITGNPGSAATTINNNFQTIADQIDLLVSRDAESPNTMQNDLDMNSNEILNLGSPTTSQSAARWADVVDAVAVSTPLPSQTGNANKVVSTDGTALAFVDTLAMADGSTSTPAYRFSGDTDTGVYRRGANELAIVAGGRVRAVVKQNGDTTELQLWSGDTADTGDVYIRFCEEDGSTKGFVGFTASGDDTFSLTSYEDFRMKFRTGDGTGTGFINRAHVYGNGANESWLAIESPRADDVGGCYVRFVEDDPTVTKGYVGYTSTTDNDLDIINSESGSHIDLQTTGSGVVKVQAPLAITDGITAPAALTGFAQIYVDTADGDLKIRFSDGTIKTIVTDT